MKFSKGQLRLWRTEWGSKMVLVMVTADHYGYEGWLPVVVVATGIKCQIQVGATREIEETDIICPLQNPST